MTGLAAAHGALTEQLTGWPAPDDGQDGLRRRYLALLARYGPAALARDGGPEHVTASCFVLSPDLRRTLLCFHRRGQFWVQPGGHLESGDDDVAAAALREAAEETGVDTLTLADGPLDLDRHLLSGAFGRCRAHWDVGVAAVAPDQVLPRTSPESEQVGWFALADLPAPLADRVGLRLQRFVRLLDPDRRISAGDGG